MPTTIPTSFILLITIVIIGGQKMRIKVCDPTLMKNWQIVERTSRGPKTMSILSGIYVKAYDDKITLMATDLKTSIKCTVHDAVIEEEGESIFPTKGVGEIIKKLSLDFLIEATNERITIKHERDKFSFTTYPTEDFPKLPTSTSATLVCRIDAQELLRIISEGSFTGSSTEEFPQYLSSSLLEFKENTARLIATDGKRLSLSEAELIETNVDEQTILIPIRGINELERILSTLSGDAVVEILYDDSQCYFKTNDIELVIRRVESVFPPYERIISSDKTTWMVVDRQKLIDALEKVEVVVRDYNKVVILDLNPAGNLFISAYAQNIGEAFMELDADIDGEPLEVGFNVSYLLQGVKAIEDATVRLSFNGPHGQMRLKKLGSDNFLYILMPVILPDDMLKEKEEIDEV